MKLTGTSLIGFQNGEETSKIFFGIDPTTGKKLEPPFHAATISEVKRAATLSSNAFEIYSHKSGTEKGTFLRKIADNIEDLGDDLVVRAIQETGLLAPRIKSERDRTTGQLRLFADLVEQGSWVEARIEHAIPNREPIPKPDLRMVMRPIGPVVVFCASNFPLAFSVAGGDTASALAGGNTVIVKAHRAHPGTAEMIGHAVIKAVRESGLPEGTFSLVHGSGSEVGIALVKEPNIKGVGFTGSHSGGRALWDAAASRPVPIPVYAEMSSINPVFILPEALAKDTNKIADGLQASVTLGVGQFCTNPGVVVLEKSAVTPHFISRFSQIMNETSVGCMLTSDIFSAYKESIAKKARLLGVKSIALRESDTGQNGFRAGIAVFLSDAETFLQNPALSNEVFGPSTHLVTYTTRDELLNIARSLQGQLTATVHGTGEELEAYSELIAVLEQKAGRLIINGFPTGVDVCHAMVHGGPYPATTDGRSTSVGTYAIYRFTRPVSYQNFPDACLPDELKEDNPLGIWRMVDGDLTKEPV